MSELQNAISVAPNKEPRLLINHRNVHLLQDRAAMIFRIVHARRQHDRFVVNRLVGDLVEQMGNAVEACALLVNGLDDPPGRLRDVGERRLLGLGVLLPHSGGWSRGRDFVFCSAPAEEDRPRAVHASCLRSPFQACHTATPSYLSEIEMELP